MSKTIQVNEKVRAKGWEIAEELQVRFNKEGIFVVNLIGSPGSGKTSLLEALAPKLAGRAAVIEGDLATDEDKRRIEAAGMRAWQINTVGACHLDAAMVREALGQFSVDGVDFLFIENVGNLVCPASFEIGEHLKVAVVGITEGPDKPAKYPKAMKVSSAMVITKIDLLPYVPCDTDRMTNDVQTIVPGMPVFLCSATQGDGLDAFMAWLEDQRAAAIK